MMTSYRAGSTIVSPSLVGRAAELRALVDVLAAPPAVAVVVGEAGIGKSRLVAELSRHLTGRQVIRGWCRRIREPFPLGPVIDAVRSLGEDLSGARLSPVVGTLRPLLPELEHLLPPRPDPLDDRAADRHRLFRGLVELLAAPGPTVLVIEDLHWVDELTVDFLSYLITDPPPGLSVVLTYRAEEIDPQVRALTAVAPHSGGRIAIDLAPLDADQTGELAAAVLGTDAVSAEFADYLCARAAGLPFAIEELLALLRTKNLLVRSPSGWARREIEELNVPLRVRDSVLDRLAGLARDTRTVIQAAAVLQGPVPASVLVATAGVAPTALGPALACGLLTETTDAAPATLPETVAFRHPLAAQAIYEDLSGETRRELHSHAAAALDTLRPVPLGQLAHHLRLAGRTGEWATVAERAAVQAIELGDDAEAARLLREVLTTALLASEPRGRVAALFAQVASEAYVGPEAFDLVAPVLEQDIPVPVRGELRFRGALLLNQLSQDSIRVFDLLISASEDLDHRPDLKAWALACLGAPLAPGLPLAERVGHLSQARALLDEVDDRVFEVFLLGKIGSFLAPTGHPSWRDVTERMVARARSAPASRRELGAYNSATVACCVLGDHATARLLLDQAGPAVARSESPRMELRYEAARVLHDYCTGAWTDLRARARTAYDGLDLDVCTRHDVEAVVICLDVAQGGLKPGRGGLGAAARRWAGIGVDQSAIVFGALARAAVARDDTEGALACVDHLLAEARARDLWAPVGQALPALAAALIHAGRAAEADELVDTFADKVRGMDVPLAPAAVGHARGLLTGSSADLLAAAESYGALAHPYLAAQARESAAEVLLTTGGPTTAGPHLAAAISTYQRLGARADENRASGLARRNGISVPARHRGGQGGYGGALSPREREVAALAAGGRTNKEIAATLHVSTKTVDKHLSATLRKLGLRSRVELARRNGESYP